MPAAPRALGAGRRRAAERERQRRHRGGSSLFRACTTTHSNESSLPCTDTRTHAQTHTDTLSLMNCFSSNAVTFCRKRRTKVFFATMEAIQLSVFTHLLSTCSIARPRVRLRDVWAIRTDTYVHLLAPCLFINLINLPSQPVRGGCDLSVPRQQVCEED